MIVDHAAATPPPLRPHVGVQHDERASVSQGDLYRLRGLHGELLLAAHPLLRQINGTVDPMLYLPNLLFNSTRRLGSHLLSHRVGRPFRKERNSACPKRLQHVSNDRLRPAMNVIPGVLAGIVQSINSKLVVTSDVLLPPPVQVAVPLVAAGFDPDEAASREVKSPAPPSPDLVLTSGPREPRVPKQSQSVGLQPALHLTVCVVSHDRSCRAMYVLTATSHLDFRARPCRRPSVVHLPPQRPSIERPVPVALENGRQVKQGPGPGE